MKTSIRFAFAMTLGLLLTGCSQDSGLTIKKAELTDNEELLFESIAKETYLFDLTGEIAVGKQMSVGVEEYHFGDLKDDQSFISLGKSIEDEESDSDSDYRKLLITLNEIQNSSNVTIDVKIKTNYGSSFASGAEMGPLETEEKAYSSNEIVEDEMDLFDLEEDKRSYIAYYAISPDGALRSFDIEHATQPNDEYEFLYLFYVETHDFEE